MVKSIINGDNDIIPINFPSVIFQSLLPSGKLTQLWKIAHS